MAVESKSTIISFATLKVFLLDEFAPLVNSAEVHNELGQMWEEQTESSIMFGYRVQCDTSYTESSNAGRKIMA